MRDEGGGRGSKIPKILRTSFKYGPLDLTCFNYLLINLEICRNIQYFREIISLNTLRTDGNE